MENDSQKVEKILADIALENSLLHKTVRDTYEKFWRSVKYFMGLDDMPRIIIRNFGTFEPHIRSVEKQINRIKEKESEGKEVKDKEKRLENLYRAKERLLKESETRRHSNGGSKEVPDPDSGSEHIQ